jgi:hypothetical protein
MTTEILSFLPPYASNISGRKDQFLPVLSEAEISRIEPFGERRKYRRGERLFAAGERAPGMFVVLKGTLTMSLRDGRVVPVELAPAVTVNAVIPSQIASARTDTLVDYKQAAITGTPLGRLVTEEEIANVVVRICGPEFDFMTGRSIVLDGGRALPRFPKLEL